MNAPTAAHSTDGQAGSSFPAPDAEAQVASQMMLAEYARIAH